MRESLKLSAAKIIAAVETHYGISTAALSFLPLGNDSATSVYRLDAHNGATYFCKLRTRAGFSIPGLTVPQFLYVQGVPHILAPLTTLDQKLWVEGSEFALTLYPFIEHGRTAAHSGLTEAQWREFGAMVRQYHTLPLPPDLLEILPREQFVPKQRELFPLLEAAMARHVFANDAERQLAEYWQSQHAVIQELVTRADLLGHALRQLRGHRVLCHADMHTYNILLNPANEFWLVDWDEVMLALPERDLMFVVGGISTSLVSPQQTALFFQGYNGPLPDAHALAYFRAAWAVQDLAAYGESVFFLTDVSDESRQEAVQGLMNLFAPGEIVDIALASET